MRYSMQLGIVAALLLQLLPAFADDVITNVMSPVVSYQYPNDVGSEALINGGISSPIVSYQYFNALSEPGATLISPIVSYQYFEWPGSDILNLQSSPQVSYYYQFLDAPVLNIVPTNRTPTTNEITPQLAALPTTSQLLAYHGGIFTPNLNSIDPNQTTIVLTHGWIPTLAGIDLYTLVGVSSWPTNFAAQLRANGIPGNIVAWDWSYVARSPVDKPGIPEQQTGDQGQILGEKLLLKLGANYSKPIQFIGHSLGTLVNASAANYLHGDRWAQENVSPTPWPGTNALMTLFDEAEVARGVSSFSADIDTLAYAHTFLPSMRLGSEAERPQKRDAAGFHLTFLVCSLWCRGAAVRRHHLRLWFGVRDYRQLAWRYRYSARGRRSGLVRARHHPFTSAVQSSETLCLDTQ